MLWTRSRTYALITALALVLVMASVPGAGATGSRASAHHGANAYKVTKLVSDQAGHALNLDPNLVNAWGLAAGPTTPWWVADNGTNLSTLYTGDGTTLSLVVRVGGAPTGEVFNGGSNFVVSHGGYSGPATFLFSGEGGLIRGWNGSVPPSSTKAFIGVDRSGEDAVYKGLALASTSSGDFLYATDFHNGRVDMFDGDFNLVTPPGAFVDPGIPGKYAPFGIQDIGGVLFVTYAKQDADKEDDVPGPGHGFVDMFDTSGAFLGRVATRGQLNSPWGLTIAPSDFGRFEGDLLVGNFGSGKINAYERESDGTYTFAGRLKRLNRKVIRIDGLWALQFGNDSAAGSKDQLFFTAGPDDESHGLFGVIEAAA